MNILIADKLSSNALDNLGKLGSSTVDYRPDLKSEDLASAIDKSEIVIVRSTKVTASAIYSGKNLGLIIRAGAGVNTIDLQAASDMGVQVANCPGKNADAVAELAVGLMAALDRNIVANSLELRQGKWNKKVWSTAKGLKGRVLGILGYGAIGSRTAEIAMAMGMKIAAWSRSLDSQRANELGIQHCSDPMELAAISDVVSVHLASAPETAGLVGEEFLNAMKEGSYLVNCARGEIINTKALLRIAPEKGIKVALDVYEREPAGGSGDFQHKELAELITGTHHIGASTEQASQAIADEVVYIVTSYIETGNSLNRVNTLSKSNAACSLVVRHYNRVGALASVLDELRATKINVEEMENSIFPGGKAAVCSLKLDGIPSQSTIDSISKREHIIRLTLRT